MRLRHYMMIVGLPAFALALLSLAGLARLFLLPEFERQDALRAQQNAQRAASAVAQDLSSMERITTDWAWWDETYQAAQGGGEAFAQVNLIDNTFENLQINLIMLLDAKGEVVLARSFDLHSGQRVDVPQSLLAQINSANPLLPDLNAPPAAHSGLLLLTEGVLNLAVAPILFSNLEGPPAGTLVIGRWLDQDRLEYLSNLIGLPIEVLAAPNPADLSTLGWQPGLPTGDYWSRLLDAQSIDGFAALQDIYGDRSVILRVRSSRQVYQNGVASLRFFTIGLASVLALLSLVGMWLVDRKISKRLIEMSQRMEAINHAEGQPDPLPVQGRDEISGLASAFNAMLERIQRSEMRLVESEQRMRMIVENLPVMVEALDADERIVFWNKECERVTGYSAEEILTHPRPLELLHPDQVYLNEMLQRSYADPGHRDMVWELTCKDGTVKSIAYSNFSRQCPIPGWHEWAIGVDISEQEAALDALRKSEERYRTFINSTTDLVFLKDSHLRHILVNTVYQQFFGIPEAELVGKTDFELMPEAHAAACRASDLQTLESMDFTVSRETQGDREYETRKFPVRLGKGEIGVGAFIRDVTEQVRADGLIKAALEERTVLLREVQHRSKNNLQAMISLMQMRDEMIKDPDMHQLLLQLEEQARAMALVYEQLYHSESLSEVSMQAYLSQLVNNLTLVFETGYNIKLEIRALNAAGKPLALPANRAMPCGLIVNELVTNALKYAFPPGFAGRPQIRVEMSEAADGLICLQVADNGVGLAPGFDPKAQKSLGMRLVRLWATHQMDGEFEMQSPPGVQFTITFRNSE